MLAGALVRLAREKGIYSGPNIGGPLLVLAGLATVGDIMPLSGDNRIIVRESLARFWRYAPPGVKELLARALRTTPESLTSVDYAFRIVPRINADGRLASGMDAMKLVMTDDREEARRLAVAVDARNVERKSIEQSMSEKALALVEKGAPAQVIEISGGHKGVVGIVASRVMDSEAVGKRAPVAITVGRHGSVRAPEGYNVRDALAASDDALDNFGGHAAAGGFTVKEGMFAEFKRLFRKACAAQAAALSCGAAGATGFFDAAVSPRDVTLDFAKWIKNLEPFGEGNPEPVFAMKGVFMSNVRPLGADGKHMSFSAKTVPALRCVWWGHGGDVETVRAKSSRPCDLVFRISVSSYGEQHPELEIIDMFPSACSPADGETQP
jgi:single-stranded-DNA-specific exonuclease